MHRIIHDRAVFTVLYLPAHGPGHQEGPVFCVLQSTIVVQSYYDCTLVLSRRSVLRPTGGTDQVSREILNTAISIEVVTLVFFSHSASSEAEILDTVSDEAQKLRLRP